MMVLPTKRERELYKIWTPYIEKAIYDGLSFKGYELKSEAPKKAHSAYKEWRKIIRDTPQNPNFM